MDLIKLDFSNPNLLHLYYHYINVGCIDFNASCMDDLPTLIRRSND